MTTRNRKAEIFTMKADGTDPQVLVSMPGASSIDPRWSPTGTHVAFVVIPDASGPDDQASAPVIYAVDVATKAMTKLSR